MSTTTLIRNGIVVTCVAGNRLPVHFRADVLVKDDQIVDVSRDTSIAPETGWTVIDATDKLVAPGFVDTHRHCWEGAYKWMGEWALMEYVAKCLTLLPALIDAEDAYASQLLGMLEALNAGVTTVVDHCHLTPSPEVFDALLKSSIKSGIRSYICFARWDGLHGKGSQKEWQMALLKKYATEGLGSSRVKLGLAVDAVGGDAFYNLLRDELWPLADEHGIDVLSSHVVGGVNPIGGDVIDQLSARGLLDRPVLFIHANNVTEEHTKMIKESDSSISSTPEIELHMSHGNPVGLEQDEAGVRVGLGVDCSTVVSGDMFAAMRSALTYQRGADNSRLAKDGKIPLSNKWRAGDVFRLATIGGARAIHKEDILGSIETGKKADIILYDTTTPSMLGAERDPVQAIVMHAAASDVVMVLVDGEVVVDKTPSGPAGGFRRVQWSEEVRRVRESLQRILRKVEDWDASENESYTALRGMWGLDAITVEKY